MRIQPKSDKEIAESSLWTPGEYGFEILDYAAIGTSIQRTEDTISRKGNEMIQVVVRVFNGDGRSIIVLDYLLESMMKKLKNACYACGIIDRYESGELVANDFIGKQGNLILEVQPERPDGNGGFYRAKNAIKDYVPTPVAASSPSTSQSDDDEIPF